MANLEGEWLERNKWRDYPFETIPEPAAATPAVVGVTPPHQNFVVDAALFICDPTRKDHIHGFVQIDLVGAAATMRDITDSTYVSFAFTSEVSADTNYTTMYGWDSGGSSYYLYLVVQRNIYDQITWVDAVDQIPILVPRAYPVRTDRVDSLAVDTGILTIDLGDSIRLAEGNNLALSLDPDTPQIQALKLYEPTRTPSHRIVISAEAGKGTGRVAASCNDPVDSVRTINNQGPIDGNVQLTGDSCYRISRPAGTVSATEFDSDPNTLQIANDCQVCSDCDEFATMLENIRRIKDEGLAVKAIWEQARASLNEVISTWNTKLTCVGTECRAQIYAYAYTGWLVTTQIWIGNPGDCLRSGAEVTISFAGGDYDPIYVEGSGHVYTDDSMYSQIEPSISGGTFTLLDNSAIKSGGYKIFILTVRMQPSDDRIDDAVVNVNADVTMCGQSLEELGVSVRLKSNQNKS